MADFITLSCPSCGGRLQITSDVERFACSYCGNEQVVRRGGGIVSLAPVMEGLQRVQASTDRVADELAYQRLSRDMDEARAKIETAKTALKSLVWKETQRNNLVSSLVSIALTFIAVVFLLAGIASFVSASSAGTSPSASGGVITFIIGGALALIVRARWSGNSQVHKARLQAESNVALAQRAYDDLSQQREQKRTFVK